MPIDVDTLVDLWTTIPQSVCCDVFTCTNQQVVAGHAVHEDNLGHMELETRMLQTETVSVLHVA